MFLQGFYFPGSLPVGELAGDAEGCGHFGEEVGDTYGCAVHFEADGYDGVGLESPGVAVEGVGFVVVEELSGDEPVKAQQPAVEFVGEAFAFALCGAGYVGLDEESSVDGVEPVGVLDAVFVGGEVVFEVEVLEVGVPSCQLVGFEDASVAWASAQVYEFDASMFVEEAHLAACFFFASYAEECFYLGVVGVEAVVR